MRRAHRQMVLVIAGLTFASSPAFGAWLRPCATAHLVASWKRDGLWRTAAVYDPPKSVDRHQVRYVGQVRAGGRAYRIYYDDSSNPDTATHHGNQDLVVTAAGGKFLGLYDVSDITDIYGEPIRTEGPDVLFPPGKANGVPFRSNRIHFGPEGPPKKITRFYGYDLEFSTPAEIRKMDPKGKPWPEPGPRIADYCKR